jgi:hypothetical protein
MLLLALVGVGQLPSILLYVLAVALFLLVLYWIIGLIPALATYATRIVLIVGGLIALYFLVAMIGGV